MAPFLALISSLLLTLYTVPRPAIGFGFPYGSKAVRGVNLGGWLVLEPWITPSIFDNTGNNAIVDEFTFCKYQNIETATATLHQHWDTWITAEDFADISAAGLNHVRLPIGYWAFQVGPGEPYIQGQIQYLNRAVDWASQHGLKVIVDVHGLPGSQNGFDNSGQRKPFPQWQSNQANIDRSNAIIKTIAGMFKDNSQTVPIIQPVNEPAGFDGPNILNKLKQYYLDSYGNIRFPYGNDRQSDTIELIHDAFQPLSYWKGWQTVPGFQGVAMDTHIYHMFTQDGIGLTPSQHIERACNSRTTLSKFDLWLIVGEWTPAATDCAKYLNGRGVGARYDGTFPGSVRIGSCHGLTGSASTFSTAYKTFLRQFWEAQVTTYEAAANGWIQWTWKAENADEWTYQAGLQNGWIPQDPTNRMFPKVCG